MTEAQAVQFYREEPLASIPRMSTVPWNMAAGVERWDVAKLLVENFDILLDPEQMLGRVFVSAGAGSLSEEQTSLFRSIVKRKSVSCLRGAFAGAALAGRLDFEMAFYIVDRLCMDEALDEAALMGLAEVAALDGNVEVVKYLATFASPPYFLFLFYFFLFLFVIIIIIIIFFFFCFLVGVPDANWRSVFLIPVAE